MQCEKAMQKKFLEDNSWECYAVLDFQLSLFFHTTSPLRYSLFDKMIKCFVIIK